MDKGGGKRGKGILDGEEDKTTLSLSLNLFTILLADLEKKIKRGDWGRGKLGTGKVYTQIM